MAVQLILKNSSIEDRRPTAAQLANGEISLNYNEAGPFVACKDTAGNIQSLGGVKFASDAPADPPIGAWWFSTAFSSLFVYDGNTWLAVGGGGGGGGGSIDAVLGGEGIDTTVAGTVVTVAVELAEGRDGLEFDADRLKATTASKTAFGSVSVGENIDVSTAGEISIPLATETVPGIVKVGNGIDVDINGTISVDIPQTLNYRGSCLLANSPTGQINPNPPVLGDAYINGEDASAIDAGWTGLSGSSAAGDLVVWDGTEWELIGTGGTAYWDRTGTILSPSNAGDKAQTASTVDSDPDATLVTKDYLEDQRVTTSDTAPVTADSRDGDLWWNTNDGRLYVYYEDANSSQWVDASPDSQVSSEYWKRIAGPYLAPDNDGDGININGDNILLNADGSAEFANSRLDIAADGELSVTATTGNVLTLKRDGNGTNVGVDYGVSGTGVRTGLAGTDAFGITTPGANLNSSPIQLKSDGSAEFDGSIEIGSDYASAAVPGPNITLNSAIDTSTYPLGSSIFRKDYATFTEDDQDAFNDSTALIIRNADKTNIVSGSFLRIDTIGTTGYLSNWWVGAKQEVANSTNDDTNGSSFKISQLTVNENKTVADRLIIERTGQVFIPGSTRIGGLSSAPNIELNANGSARFEGTQVDFGSDAGSLIRFARPADGNYSCSLGFDSRFNAPIGNNTFGIINNSGGSQINVGLADSSGAKFSVQTLNTGTNLFEEVASISKDGSAQFNSILQATNLSADSTHIYNNSYLGQFGNANGTKCLIKGTGLFLGADLQSINSPTPTNTNTKILTDGSAEFSGDITANNVTFNLEADDDTKYTSTTDSEGVETRVYNGATLNVKDRLQKADAALLALKTAAVAATDFASLQAAIVTALADI